MAQPETATLAGGCFWCLEAVYEQLEGVSKVVSGYSGGHAQGPTYEAVCTGATGHAEVVQVTFDPAVTPYEQILEVFFSIHDPTQRARQGNDVGTQYRSAIFTHSPQQAATAAQVIARLGASDLFDASIVTQVEPFSRFWPAEAYHQQYFRRNPTQGYCQMVVAPKVAKFRKSWASKLRAPPAI